MDGPPKSGRLGDLKPILAAFDRISLNQMQAGASDVGRGFSPGVEAEAPAYI